MNHASTTRFGTVWADLPRAVSSLRAAASLSGDLGPFEAVSHASAVVAAEGLMFALSTRSIQDTAKSCEPGQLVLATILASLRGVNAGCVISDRPRHINREADTFAFDCAGRILRWGLNPSEILAGSVRLLAMGDTDHRILSVASALENFADFSVLNSNGAPE